MVKDFFITLILFSIALPIFSQRRGIVLSMETGMPIREVKVYTNNGQVAVTDYTGHYEIKQTFKSATFVKGNFVSLTLNNYEINDTTELLPKLNSLDEVIIWGKRKRIILNIQRAMQDNKYYYTPKAGFSFDLFSLFNKSKGLNKKERLKHDEIIKSY